VTDRDRNLRLLSGETLRNLAKRADDRLGTEIDRVQLTDQAFREALELTLAIEAEIQRRRNR
jgi:hypothetical protein